MILSPSATRKLQFLESLRWICLKISLFLLQVLLCSVTAVRHSSATPNVRQNRNATRMKHAGPMCSVRQSGGG